MSAFDSDFSRISKLLLDRDHASAEAALKRRQEYTVTLCCGDDVASSYTLQLAVLTAASIACRCFPGAVRAVYSPTLAKAPLLLWPWLNLAFVKAIAEILGTDTRTDTGGAKVPHSLIFGNAPAAEGALRVTFDGWIAKVGPARDVPRLLEREYFSVAGVLAASLALSELFLSFAELSIVAARRTVGMSLWRPDLDIGDAEALGIPVEYLPRDLWVLGLGHLGNAYLWSLATLPYEDPKAVEFALLDFDNVEKDNVETGIIFTIDFLSQFKTRACDAWLGHRGFKTRLVERRFDATFRLQDGEPALALCGFDSNPARRDLPQAQFRRIIDSGLGGMANNFDTISFHALPNPRTPDELWPDLSKEEAAKLTAHQERTARENPGYLELDGDDCGKRHLAGKSVAVPFVGMSAASLVVAEAVRLLHDGPAYLDIKLVLGNPDKRFARRNGSYTAQDAAGLTFIRAKKYRTPKIHESRFLHRDPENVFFCPE
jgi:hypothetical protein